MRRTKSVCMRMSLAARSIAIGAVIAMTLSWLAGCAHQTGPPPGAPQTAAHDPQTRAALLQVAQRFNNNYDNGDFGAVWDRWDARSRALISRSEYIRRHRLCAPATGAKAIVDGARRQPNGSWRVRYRIERTRLVDTWFYAHHRWVFDIIKSNPRAAKQYAMPFHRYAKAVGCSVH